MPSNLPSCARAVSFKASGVEGSAVQGFSAFTLPETNMETQKGP